MKAPTHVYVVMGETGEYSDRSEWPVVAYFDEPAAQAHVLRAETWLREQRIFNDDQSPILGDYDARTALVGQNPHDPHMPAPDYTGSRYYILTVEVAR